MGLILAAAWFASILALARDYSRRRAQSHGTSTLLDDWVHANRLTIIVQIYSCASLIIAGLAYALEVSWGNIGPLGTEISPLETTLNDAAITVYMLVAFFSALGPPILVLHSKSSASLSTLQYWGLLLLSLVAIPVIVFLPIFLVIAVIPPGAPAHTSFWLLFGVLALFSIPIQGGLSEGGKGR
jgi:hypothetical protein